MADILIREDAPLTKEEWEALDQSVVAVARKQLVARKFLQLYGPLGGGTQIVPVDRFAGVKPADVEVEGESEEPIELQEREYVPLTLLSKDFLLRWNDLAMAREGGAHLDITPAMAAAAMVAQAEDTLVFQGAAGAAGLTKVKGRTTVALGQWETGTGAGLEAVLSGWQKLTAAGFAEPFALIVSLPLFAALHRVNGSTGVLEISQIRELVKNVYPAPALKAKAAVLVAAGPENLDLAIGQDLTTAYLGNEGMDHMFRVFETLVLRVKRPGAVCVFE